MANETESGRAGSRVVDLPLSSFELEGHPLEVRVPWLPVTLWFVPAERDVRVLMTHGVSRGRIWTGKELADLLALSDRTPQVVWTLAQVKLAVDGDIVETRSRRNGDGGQGAQSA